LQLGAAQALALERRLELGQPRLQRLARRVPLGARQRQRARRRLPLRGRRVARVAQLGAQRGRRRDAGRALLGQLLHLLVQRRHDVLRLGGARLAERAARVHLVEHARRRDGELHRAQLELRELGAALAHLLPHAAQLALVRVRV